MKECFWRRNEVSEVTVKGVLVNVFWSSNEVLKNMNKEGLRKGLFGVVKKFWRVLEVSVKNWQRSFWWRSFWSYLSEEAAKRVLVKDFLGVFEVVMNFRKRVLGRYFLELSWSFESIGTNYSTVEVLLYCEFGIKCEVFEVSGCMCDLGRVRKNCFIKWKLLFAWFLSLENNVLSLTPIWIWRFEFNF